MLPKITVRGGAAGHGMTVLIDGKEVSGLRSVQINADVGEINTVTLEIIGSLDVEMEGKITVLQCKHEDAVKWNPYNGVVQCHRCGIVFTAASKLTYWLNRIFKWW